MAGGEEHYAGAVTVTVHSCVKNGDKYDFNASFAFKCEAFTGAKNPEVTVASPSDLSTSIRWNGYYSEPVTKSFSLKADPGDTITITSAFWLDPSDSGNDAFLDNDLVIYNIPIKIERKGSTWGMAAWGGLYFNVGKKIERNISGRVRIERVEGKSINGSLRIARDSQRSILGVISIEKSTTKSINGIVRISGESSKSITGSVMINNPNQKISSAQIFGMVDIKKDNLKAITGNVNIYRQNVGIITGNVNIYRTNESEITGAVTITKLGVASIEGAVRIRATTPEKLPTRWGDTDFPLPEDWGKRDKEPEAWSGTEKDAEKWDEDSKAPESWNDATSKTPEEWKDEHKTEVEWSDEVKTSPES